MIDIALRSPPQTQLQVLSVLSQGGSVSEFNPASYGDGSGNGSRGLMAQAEILDPAVPEATTSLSFFIT